MKILTLKALRDLWQIKMRALGIILLIAAGVSVYTGSYMGYFMMDNTAKTFYKQLHFADLQVTFVPVTEDEMPPLDDVRKIKGVERADSRLIIPGSIELRNKETISSVLILLNSDSHPQVNDLKITSGGYFSEPKDKETVVLEESFAREYGYKPGDTITIGIQGFYSDFRVAGTGINSEYLVWTSNPNFYIPVKGSLGIVYLPLRIMNKIFGYNIMNNIALTYTRGADSNAVQRSLEGMLKDKTILQELSKEDQYTYRTVERSLKIHRVFLPTIIVIFDIIAFLITFVTVDRMIHSQRREIGVLMALGYGPGKILRSYLLIGLILGVLGSILGCLFAFPLSFFIVEAYKRAVGFPMVIFSFAPLPLIKGSLLGIGALVFACYLPAQKIVKLDPTQAFKDAGQFYFSGLSKLARYTETIAVRLFKFSGPVRIGFRNLFRHKRLFFFSVFSLACALGLAIAFSLAAASLRKTVNTYFAREKWDMMVDFDGNIETARLAEIKSISGVKAIEPYLNGFVKLKNHNIERPYQVVGVIPQSSLREINLLRGQSFTSDTAQEIVVSREMCETLGAELGQTIEVVTQDNKVFPMKIIGVVDNLIVGQCFVPLKSCESILGKKDVCSGIIVAASGSPAALEKKLHEKEFVGRVLVQGSAKETSFKTIEEVVRFLRIYKFLSVLVIITLVFTLQTINILERESEYAVLGAIGYSQLPVAKMVFTEVGIITFLSALLSMPISEIIGRIIRNRFAERAVFTLAPDRFPYYCVTIIPVILLVILVTLFSLRYIYRMQIGGIIRNRILG